MRNIDGVNLILSYVGDESRSQREELLARTDALSYSQFELKRMLSCPVSDLTRGGERRKTSFNDIITISLKRNEVSWQQNDWVER